MRRARLIILVNQRPGYVPRPQPKRIYTILPYSIYVYIYIYYTYIHGYRELVQAVNEDFTNVYSPFYTRVTPRVKYIPTLFRHRRGCIILAHATKSARKESRFVGVVAIRVGDRISGEESCAFDGDC